MNVIKVAIGNYFAEKGRITGAKGAQELESIYKITVKEDYARLSVTDGGVIEATLKDIAPDLDGKTIQAIPDEQMRTWSWNSTADSQYLPSTILVDQQPATTTSEPRQELTGETPPEGTGVAEQQKGTMQGSTPAGTLSARKTNSAETQAGSAVTRESTKQKTKPAGTAATSDTPAILEDKIARGLSDARINAVHVEVKEDMTVILKGTVNGFALKQKALSIAKNYKSAKAVKDMIFVVGN